MDKGKGQGADRPQELKYELGLGAMVSLGVGTVIGSGILSSVREVAVTSGCTAITILAFIVGGVIIIPQNMVAAEITATCPDDGGFYVRFREAGSRPLAFLCDWTTFWGGDPPLYSVVTLTLANYIAFFIPGIIGIDIELLVTTLIVTFVIISIRSVEMSGKFLTFIASFRMFLFALLIGVGLFYADETMIGAPAVVEASTGSEALLADVSVTTRSYAGMATACSMTGEVKDPEKTTPKTLIITVLVIIAIHTSLATVVTGLLPMNLLTVSSTPTAEAAAQIPVIGPAVGVMTASIAIAIIIASLYGIIMRQPRIEYAMAKNGLLSRKFAEVCPKWKTPTNSIMYSCAVSIVLVFTTDIGALLGFFSFAALCKNALSFATMFKLHKKADYNPSRECSAWLLMTTPSVGANVIFLVSTFLWVPYESLFSAFVVVATRLLTYYFWESKNRKGGRA